MESNFQMTFGSFKNDYQSQDLRSYLNRSLWIARTKERHTSFISYIFLQPISPPK